METGENTQKEGMFASKGTGNTALGLGIAGTALALGSMGLFGLGGRGAQMNPQMSPFVTTREFYENALAMQDRRFEDYKSMRDITDGLLEKLNDINAKVEVAAATTPLYVAAETAARKAADAILVSYMNGNFQPIEIAQITVGEGATARTPYNPLINLGF